MSAAPMVYRAAPLDRLARTVTRLTWAGGGSSLALGAWLAANDNDAGWILIVVGVLVVAMTECLWRLQPLEYFVEDGAFAKRLTVRAFVTDRAKVALLDVGGASLAVSPGDRDQFLAEVGGGA